ncbi:MAG: sigma-70 family RNA polymerase sigma factor [Acidimicrobiales bacterium]
MSDLATSSDTALVIGISRWQEDCLAEVYRRHAGAVHNLARRVLIVSELADEVTQEVFIDLWKRPEQFDPTRGSLRTLLLTKAHGKAVDLIRSESKRKVREQRTAAETAHSEYDLDHYAWDLVVADQVRTALDTLPPEERLSIEMAYFKGMTYKEVAASLGAPEGTVKSRIRSGLMRLRKALSQQEVEAR